MKSAALIAGLLVGILTFVHRSEGHGYLRDPPSRSSMWRQGFSVPKNYNDNALNCGGNRNKCGVCGDPPAGNQENMAGGKYASGIISRNYTEGQTIKSTVVITANHVGWFEFHLCPNNDVSKPVTEQCLMGHVLKLANGQTRYQLKKSETGPIDIQLQLPPGVTCNQCVIRWKWMTGNSWGSDPDSGHSCVGCGTHQEQFYGCSDVSISPRGGQNPNVTPGPYTPRPTSRPVNPIYTPRPTSKPVNPIYTQRPVYPVNTQSPVTSRPYFPVNTQAPYNPYPTQAPGGGTVRPFYPVNTQAPPTSFPFYPVNTQAPYNPYPVNTQAPYNPYPVNTQAPYNPYPTIRPYPGYTQSPAVGQGTVRPYYPVNTPTPATSRPFYPVNTQAPYNPFYPVKTQAPYNPANPQGPYNYNPYGQAPATSRPFYPVNTQAPFNPFVTSRPFYPVNTQAPYNPYPTQAPATSRPFYPVNTQAPYNPFPVNTQAPYNPYPVNTQAPYNPNPLNTQAPYNPNPVNTQAPFYPVQTQAPYNPFITQKPHSGVGPYNWFPGMTQIPPRPPTHSTYITQQPARPPTLRPALPQLTAAPQPVQPVTLSPAGQLPVAGQKQCHAVGAWASQPDMKDWCNNNCNLGNCPPKFCQCA